MGAMPASRFAFGSVPWYSVLIVSAIVIGLSLCGHEQKRLKLPADLAIDLALCLIPSAIVGARLYYVAFSWDVFAADPLRILRIWEGGLAIYGGILGGAIALLLFCAVRHMPLLQLADVLVPALALGQGIGRWGNYFNMEAYGRLITNPQWQFFPAAVLIPVDSGYEWHMATFFYEFCWDMLVFVLLMVIRNHRRRKGDVFCWYLLLYCSGRTVIEGLRNDSLTFISEFVRISQILSAVAALGVVIYFFLRIRDRISAVTVVPMVSAVLCIAVVFLGEFERGAYSFLFTFSQIGLAVLMISQIAIIALWTMDSGRFSWRIAAPLLADGLFLAGLLIAGMGRANADNTYYVTLRQCAAMIQLILCGWLLCYPLYPRTSESEMD